MNLSFRLAFLLVFAGAMHAKGPHGGVTDTSSSPHAKIRSVKLEDVRWTRGFWAERFELSDHVMIPAMWQVLQIPDNGASYRNLRIAAGLEQGKFQSTNWSDGDVYKWLEAVAHVYAVTREPKLDQLMDEVIATIGKAQAPDGYISTQIQLTNKKRWEDLHNHELYNMGHLLTAACIHYRATGKGSLLAIARKTADYLYTVFQPRPKALAHFGFNPSQIMGLVELYRATGDPKYLELAGIFVDMRGSAPGGTDLNQTRTPLRKETEAVGHAVTATYLYAGATDVYEETGELNLWSALGRIWKNVVARKMYITGATGATRLGLSRHRDQVHEAFGPEFQLPNRLAYNETCANIGNAIWNWRMLEASGDPHYADVMELVLYNSMLSGMGLSGKDFFYANPLRRFSDEMPMPRNDSLQRWSDSTRKGAAKSYCCPPNVLRMLASLHEYTYGVSDSGIYVNLYGSNVLHTRLANGAVVRLKQETDYPWQGDIRVIFEAPTQKEVSILLRIPGWAAGAALKVNGSPQATPDAATFAELRRNWNKGDIVELTLPMQPRLVESNPLVEETRNQVAVIRGPVVYCLESPDLPAGVRFSEVVIPANVQFRPRFEKQLLGGVTVLEGKAKLVKHADWSGLLYRNVSPDGGSVDIQLIPYYAWANRGISFMSVWLPLAR
jgi:DUF1680 family protein